MTATVIVYNADWTTFLHEVSLQHAIRMLVRKVAVIHDKDPKRQLGVFPMPRAVRLIRYVYPHWQHDEGPPWSRAGVLHRDKRICGYCGAPAATVDHILPRAQGGTNSWTNTVAACCGCNQAKGDRTPAQAGMRLRFEPYAPRWAARTRH